MTEIPDAAAPPSGRIALFDIDNTLMRGASMYYLARGAFQQRLISPREVALFAWHQLRFIRVGENHSHLATVRERALGIGRGRSVEEITALVDSVWHAEMVDQLHPEAVAAMEHHRAAGDKIWLVSATPTVIGNVIAQKIGADGMLGTEVAVVNGCFTGELDGPVLHGPHKVAAAEALAARLGTTLADATFYSDSRNDIPLLSAVGNPMPINPDVGLRSHARRQDWPIIEVARGSRRRRRR